MQFIERDKRSEQETRSAKEAIAAALQAAKEAVAAALQAAKEAVAEQNRSSAASIAKSEEATKEQINQLRMLMEARVGALEATSGETKERVTRIEGFSGGALGKTQSANANTGLLISVGAALIMAAGFVVSLIVNFAK
jgi:hypothetical protein